MVLLQMYVPNNVKSFGSASHGVKVRACNNAHHLSVEQTQLKYLEESFPCTKEKHPDTTSCIAKFLQDHVGCNIKILGANSDFHNETCSKEQRKEMFRVSKQLEMGDDSTIYEMTKGCLSACNKKKYGLHLKDVTTEEAKTCNAKAYIFYTFFSSDLVLSSFPMSLD